MVGFNHVATIGSNGTLVLPVLDSRTGGQASVVVGPGTRKNAFRWFVTTPRLEDAERFGCPFGYERRSVRFEPVLLYVDYPVPPMTGVSLVRVACGSEAGKIAQTQIDRWVPTEETIHWPAMAFSSNTMAPDQTLEFEGSSWWKRDFRGKKTMDPWVMTTSPPLGTEVRTLSILCLFRMTWLPKKTGAKYQFVNGSAMGAPPTPQQHGTTLPPENHLAVADLGDWEDLDQDSSSDG